MRSGGHLVMAGEVPGAAVPGEVILIMVVTHGTVDTHIMVATQGTEGIHIMAVTPGTVDIHTMEVTLETPTPQPPHKIIQTASSVPINGRQLETVSTDAGNLLNWVKHFTMS